MGGRRSTRRPISNHGMWTRTIGFPRPTGTARGAVAPTHPRRVTMRSSLARPPAVLAALLLLAGACAPASPPAAKPAPAATSAPPAAAVAPAAAPTAAPAASPVALGKVRAASQNVAGDIAMYV